MSDLKTGLRTLYTSILNAMGVQITDDGTAVIETVGDTLRPVVVSNDEVLVLPTEDRLKSGDWSGVQPFHPLSENALRGESVVLKKLRVLAAARLTSTLQEAAQMLIEIAADNKMHAKLSPTASKFLDHATKVDSKTVDKVKSVMDKVSISGDHRVVAFYFHRPGEQKKNSYTRSCRVDFPIFDEFEHTEPLIFGVKMRIADKAAIKGVFQWLLDVDDDNMKDAQALFDMYGSGTTELNVPYFITLMNSFVKLAGKLNDKLKLFKKSHGDLVNALHIDLKWAEELADLGKYRDLIPPLRGNEGATSNHPGKRQETAAAAPSKPAIAVRNQLAFEPVGSAGNEAPSVPAPQQAQVVSHVPQPQQQHPRQQQAVAQAPQQQQSGERLISWSSVSNPPAQQQYMAAPMQPQGWGPVTGWPQGQQQVIGAMNARDIMRQQAYRQYQMMPTAQYNPDVYNQVMTTPVAPTQFQTYQQPQPVRTVQPTPHSGIRMPDRW